jgi:hypothetical protein
MAQERNRPATVISQDGERIEIEHDGQRLTVRMRGFPPGFTLRAGSRVILVDEPSGPVARPLVRAFVSRQPREVVERRGTLEHEGRRLELQASTVIDEPRAPGQEHGTGTYEVWIVERAEPAPTDQVIAVRRRR